MPQILAKRKARWATKHKPEYLRGAPLNPNASVQARYYTAMRKLILRMTEDVEKEIIDFYTEPHAEEYFAQDDTVSSQARILTNALIKKFDQLFNLKAKSLAGNMTSDADRSSQTALKGSLKQLSGGLTLKTDILTGELNDILNATITENVGLIKSIPAQYLQGVQGAVMRSITTGNGLKDLVPFMQKHKGITLRRARIIARDQTRKAFSNINFARMDKLGVTHYEWLHSAGGQKPRPLHIRYSGRIFSFANPPVIDEKTGQRGKPGDLINCRCRAVPIIKFEE